jgi:alpha-beta hydrolase superfamily lysophospholipase
MFRQLIARLWRRRRLRIAIFVLLGLTLALNALAFMHARSMTHFVDGGIKPLKPQYMSVGQKISALFLGVSIPKPQNDCTPDKFGLAYETCIFPSTDGTTLEAWHIPAENPRGLVLLFHGYVAAKCTLLDQAEIYHDLGYDTFLVDFRGSGGSSGYETTIGYAEADDVAAAVDYAKKQFSPHELILAGQSMGAAAILRAVALHSLKPDALVLESPFDRLFTTVKHRFEIMGAPSFPAANLLVFWGSVQQHHWAFDVNPVDSAKAVHCPTLLMNALDDPFVRPPEAKHILANLSGTKRDVWFEHVGHDAILPKYPQQWSQAVSSFMHDTFH